MSIFFPPGLIMVTKNNKMLLSIMDDGSLIGGGGGRQSFPAVKSSWAFIEEIPSYCKEIRKMPGNLKLYVCLFICFFGLMPFIRKGK